MSLRTHLLTGGADVRIDEVPDEVGGTAARGVALAAAGGAENGVTS